MALYHQFHATSVFIIPTQLLDTRLDELGSQGNYAKKLNRILLPGFESRVYSRKSVHVNRITCLALLVGGCTSQKVQLMRYTEGEGGFRPLFTNITSEFNVALHANEGAVQLLGFSVLFVYQIFQKQDYMIHLPSPVKKKNKFSPVGLHVHPRPQKAMACNGTERSTVTRPNKGLVLVPLQNITLNVRTVVIKDFLLKNVRHTRLLLCRYSLSIPKSTSLATIQKVIIIKSRTFVSSRHAGIAERIFQI